MDFYCLPLGGVTVILGTPWLTRANPIINWQPFSVELREQGRAATSNQIPKEFEPYKDVFNQELFQATVPQHRNFDCEIRLLLNSTLPKPARIYPLSPIKS